MICALQEKFAAHTMVCIHLKIAGLVRLADELSPFLHRSFHRTVETNRRTNQINHLTPLHPCQDSPREQKSVMDHGIKLGAGFDLIAAQPDRRNNGSRHQQGAVRLCRQAARPTSFIELRDPPTHIFRCVPIGRPAAGATVL